MTNFSNTELSCSAQAIIDLRDDEVGSGDDTDGITVAIGITIGLVASVGINLGQNIQASNAPPEQPKKKKGYDAEKNDWDPEKKKWWWRGLAIFVVSAIANFVAFAFAPASVLAPLEGAQFVTNFFYGWWYKKEVLMDNFWWTVLGTIFVLAGVTLPIIPIFMTSGDVAKFDENAIWCFWRGWKWWLYVGLTSFFSMVFVILLCVWSPENKKNNRVHMVLFSVPAAVVGAFGVVQAKAISELVEIFINGEWDVLTRWLFWQCLLFLGIGLSGWIFLQNNRGPKYYETVTILPLMQGCYVVFSSIGGGIFFEEFDSFSDFQSIMFAGGLCSMLVGLYFILPKVQEDKTVLDALRADDGEMTSVVLGGMFVPVMLYPNNERSEKFSIAKTSLCADTNASYRKFPRLFVNV